MSSPECSQVIRRLPDYVDGDASAATCGVIEHHLEHCANCRLLLTSLRQTAHHDQTNLQTVTPPDRPYRAPGPGLSLRF